MDKKCNVEDFASALEELVMEGIEEIVEEVVEETATEGLEEWPPPHPAFQSASRLPP